jgi:SNF2 family DNA or RNA helicase
VVPRLPEGTSSLIRIELEGDEIVIALPFNMRMIEAARNLRIRKWDPDTKTWRVPYSLDNWRNVEETMRRFSPAVNVGLRERVSADQTAREHALTIKRAGTAELDGFTFVTEPWPHQRAAVAIAAKVPGYGLWWEMGTGKTKGAIDIARYIEAKRVLVICPNEITYNWRREIRQHAGEEAFILEGPLSERRAHLVRARERPISGGRTFSILNVEAVHPLLADLAGIEWDLVIVDEATRFKNPKAKRTIALRSLAPHAKHRLILTGTPVTHSLLDLYAPIDFVYPGIFGRFQHFKFRYFDTMWVREHRRFELVPRADTIDELLEILDKVTYRVTKKEVLPDLPEKLPPQYMEVELEHEQRLAYERMDHIFRAWVKTLKDEELIAEAKIVLTKMMRLSEITSGFLRNEAGEVHWFPNHVKAQVVDDLIADLAPGKVVIFCQWRPECEFYAARYESEGSALIYGDMQPRDRDAIVNAFQTEASPRILVCQEGSGGIGINLTAAATAIYTSRSYSLEQYLQSQDRLHRAGQKQEVNLIIVQARDTIDEDIDAVLSGKKSIADLVTKVREEA